MNVKNLLELSIGLIFLFFVVISPRVSSLIIDGCDSCPPICSIDCNELLSGRSTVPGDIDWFNYTFPLTCNITIQVKPNSTLGGYNLTAIWDSSSCSGYNCSVSGTGSVISCPNASLSPGTYYFKVGHRLDATSSYNMSLSCGVRCDSCPPDDGCIVDSNKTLMNLSNPVNDVDWVKFTIPSYRSVTIGVNPSTGGWYNLTLYQDSMSCSGFSQYRGGALSTPVSITNSSLPPGTYYLKIGHVLGATSTYNLNLSSADVIVRKPMIISPENKTYYNSSINLTTKCVGNFVSYNINRSLDNGGQITFGFFIANDTVFTDMTTISSLPWGVHSIYVTCYNGSTQNSSDILFFTTVQPQYKLNGWVAGPKLFTIGRSELINIYVQNLGNLEDTFNVSFKKTAQDISLNDVSQLIDVNIPSKDIVQVEPGNIGNTVATITLLGPINTGSITFNITSETNSSVSQLVTIQVVTGYPINLPEFELLGMIQVLIFAVCIFLVLKIHRNNQVGYYD